MTDNSKKEPGRGDPCPKCGKTLVVRPGMFFLSGIGSFSGLFCEPCNSGWNDPGDDFLGAAIKRDRVRTETGKDGQDILEARPLDLYDENGRRIM